MANTNTPSGLQVIRAGGAYSFNAQGNLYSVPTTDSTNAYYLNDAVKITGGSSVEGVPNIVKAAGTDILLGSLQAIYPVYPQASLEGSTSPQLGVTYIPAAKPQAYFVLVNDDFSTIYMIQDDGITTAKLTAAYANANSSLTVTNGATPTSASATVLLSSSFDTTISLNIKLQGLVQKNLGASGGNEYGAYAKYQCRINTAFLTPNGSTGATAA